jgi:predicted TPR repeat methyltransferase
MHPESELARYFVATLGAGPIPAKPPDVYVRELFDSYAGRFDEHLGRQLQYRLPDVMATTLKDLFARDLPWRSLLDLGCGTGLVGVAVRGMTDRLTGVDLSPRMVEKARQKEVYDELHVADIVEFVGPLAEAFDVVLAADVFIYLGDLEPVIRGVAAALGPRGVLAFSVEEGAAGSSYSLQSSGRYAHSRTYVETLAAGAGLEELRVTRLDLRVEAGRAIPGLLFVFRLPG